MPKSVLDYLERICKRGLYWPFLYDPETNQPSATLMFFYISFFVSCSAIVTSSTMMIIKGDYLSSTFAPTILLVLGFVFYRLRKLDHVKIDLDDKEIDLSSENKGENSEK